MTDAGRVAADRQRTGGHPAEFSRVSQLRALSVGVGIILVAFGLVLLVHKVGGCPHDHTHEGLCLDLSSYSPHVVAGWVLIGAAVLVVMVTFAVTWFWRPRTRA
jgi:hypothetical protein